MRKLILFLTLPLFALDLITKQFIVWNFKDPSALDFNQTTVTETGSLFVKEYFASEGEIAPGDAGDFKEIEGRMVNIHNLKGIKVINGFFSIVRVHNNGVAFGVGNGTAWANWLFGGITIAALFLIWWLCRNNAFPTKTSRVAVALLLSGVFGNLLDRFTRGYVVDFLHFYWGDNQWPSFNVADSCICIAAGLLFFSAFQKAPVKSPAEQNA